MQLRPYQTKIIADITQCTGRVLAVMPTGGGKTRCAAKLNQIVSGRTVTIVHRQELVTQLSCAMAAAKCWHTVVAPKSVVDYSRERQIALFGQSWIINGAPAIVAGIDTLLRREIALDDVRLWQIDEGHHVVPGNKWHKAVEMMPQAFGVGWTATPHRTDRRALGDVYNNLLLGPSTRDLRDASYLCPIRVFAPPPAIARDMLPIGSSGEFLAKPLHTAMRQSPIVGDIVKEYLRLAPGAPGLIFATDVEMAETHAVAFKNAGINAVVITYRTAGKLRDKALDDLAAGRLQIIVNVDMFGEGTDIPEVSYIGCARPTESLSLWRQMCGRVMRLSPNKYFGIVSDHVGNTLRHGMPDCDIPWSLEGRKRNEGSEVNVRVRTCHQCFFVFDAHETICPFCGHQNEKILATSPDQVEGDLTEYTPELIAELTAKANNAIKAPPPVKPRNPRDAAIFKNMSARRNAQLQLRDAINFWLSNLPSALNKYREFYRTFGIDVLSAQGLNGNDASKLCDKIRNGCNQ